MPKMPREITVSNADANVDPGEGGWVVAQRPDLRLTIDLATATVHGTGSGQGAGVPSVLTAQQSSSLTRTQRHPVGSAQAHVSVEGGPDRDAGTVREVAPTRMVGTRQRSAPAPTQPIPVAKARRPRDGVLGRFGVRPMLIACDGIAALVGSLVVHHGIERTNLVFVLVLVVVYSTGNLYRSRLSMSVLDDMPRLAGRWLAAVAITILTQTAFTRLRWEVQVVKWDLVAAAAVALGLVLVFRTACYALVRSLRKRRRVVHRTLVLGAGRVGAQVAEVLLDHPEYGLHPIGFLDSDPWLGPKELPLPILGRTDALYHVLTDHDVNNVVVAFGSMRESAMVDVIRTCDRLDTEIFIVPRLFELHHVSDDMDSVWGLPLVRLRRAARRSRGWQVKRAFDIAVSSVALLLVSPIMIIAALAVRLEGGPGIIFRQERVGVDGRRFKVMKFRSMKPVDETESQTNWNISNDDRLGPVGRFLRKSSIDELPQLINIVKGEMSLVGPRPERPHFVDQFCEAYPRYVARHRVPSGLTGWAQIHGLRGDTSIADRARFDNYYIENWSLWLDVKIMLRTVGSVIRGDGA